jgi:hypothetical protein
MTEPGLFGRSGPARSVTVKVPGMTLARTIRAAPTTAHRPVDDVYGKGAGPILYALVHQPPRVIVLRLVTHAPGRGCQSRTAVASTSTSTSGSNR